MIREANVRDLDKMLELYEHIPEDNILKESINLKGTWEQIINAPGHHVIVCELDGKIVASCVCALIPSPIRDMQPYAFIEHVVTYGEYGEMGCGKECLDFALKLAKDHDCYKMKTLLRSNSKSIDDFEHAPENKDLYDKYYFGWYEIEADNLAFYILETQLKFKRILYDRYEDFVNDTIKAFDSVSLETLTKFSKKGKTAVHSAVAYLGIAMTKYLISRGVDINITTKDGANLLHVACGCGNMKLIKFLLEAGADQHARTNNGHLPIASLSSHVDVNDELFETLDMLDAMNEPNNDSASILLLRILKYKEESKASIALAEYLCAHGADVNKLDEYGCTLLHNVVKLHGKLEIIDWILNAGVDIDALDNSGHSALMYMLIWNDMKRAKYLLERGADCNLPNKNGDTPYTYALRMGLTEIVKYMKNHDEVRLEDLKKPGRRELERIAEYGRESRMRDAKEQWQERCEREGVGQITYRYMTRDEFHANRSYDEEKEDAMYEALMKIAHGENCRLGGGGGECTQAVIYVLDYGYTMIDYGDRGSWSGACRSESGGWEWELIFFYNGDFEAVLYKLLSHVW